MGRKSDTQPLASMKDEQGYRCTWTDLLPMSPAGHLGFETGRADTEKTGKRDCSTCSGHKLTGQQIAHSPKQARSL